MKLHPYSVSSFLSAALSFNLSVFTCAVFRYYSPSSKRLSLVLKNFDTNHLNIDIVSSGPAIHYLRIALAICS
jgi:hypothetical protein